MSNHIWRIRNRVTNTDFGLFVATTAEAALEKLAHEGAYRDAAHMLRATRAGDDLEVIAITEVQP